MKSQTLVYSLYTIQYESVVSGYCFKLFLYILQDFSMKIVIPDLDENTQTTKLRFLPGNTEIR